MGLTDALVIVGAGRRDIGDTDGVGAGLAVVAVGGEATLDAGERGGVADLACGGAVLGAGGVCCGVVAGPEAGRQREDESQGAGQGEGVSH